MAHLSVVAEEIDLEQPILVEGFPGAGLVGKIAADHLVDTLSLTHYANVHCHTLPSIAVYDEGDAELETPVRLHASDDGSLVVLQSDVPIDPEAATEFADCFSPWLEDNALPFFLAGLPTDDRGGEPAVYGVYTGDAGEHIERLRLDSPPERGVVKGPSGALLSHAIEHDLDAVGLLVETDPSFPDPTGAKCLLQVGVGPMTGFDVSLGMLDDRAERIQQSREQLAKQMREGDEQSSEAKPLRMFQ